MNSSISEWLSSLPLTKAVLTSAVRSSSEASNINAVLKLIDCRAPSFTAL